MNWLNLKTAKLFTNRRASQIWGEKKFSQKIISIKIISNLKLFISTLFFLNFSLLMSEAYAWEVDFSRRVKVIDSSKSVNEMRWPSSVKSNEELFSEAPLEKLFSATEPTQSIAILQTEEGFVPDTLRLRKDGVYKIYITNVNEKFKNASFILDAFGQSHGTYFGKPKSFELTAKVNGIFPFLSPETGAQGKIIIFSDKENPLPMAAAEAAPKNKKLSEKLSNLRP